jgi:hypothetical protein
MVAFEGTFGVILTRRPCHIPNRREHLSAILAGVLALLASFIKDVVPLKGTEGMFLAR